MHQFNVSWLKHVDFLSWQHSYRTQGASLALQNSFFLQLCLVFSGKVYDLKISKDKLCGYCKLTLHFSPGHIHLDNKAIEGEGWSFLGFFQCYFYFSDHKQGLYINCLINLLKFTQLKFCIRTYEVYRFAWVTKIYKLCKEYLVTGLYKTHPVRYLLLLVKTIHRNKHLVVFFSFISLPEFNE